MSFKVVKIRINNLTFPKIHHIIRILCTLSQKKADFLPNTKAYTTPWGIRNSCSSMSCQQIIYSIPIS